MTREILAEKEQLRSLYLQDLKREVNYGGKVRPRVYKVDQIWAKIGAIYNGLTPIDVTDYENVWVWSDIHFGHANIIKYCKRPFLNAEDMTMRLIENHNRVVNPATDLVIWVGDVSFLNETLTNEILDYLYGDRILVVGNHDFTRKKRIKKLDFNEIHLLYVLDDPIAPMVFTHYTMENVPSPWINVHGHVHNSPYDVQDSLQHINVCVEVLDYKPMHLSQLQRMARTRMESLDGR